MELAPLLSPSQKKKEKQKREKQKWNSADSSKLLAVVKEIITTLLWIFS
jgi:hypothetical protein